MERSLEQLQVVTTEEAADQLKVTKEHASVILHRMAKSKKAEKIRKGLYHIKPSKESKRPPNRYLVASKIAPDATLCYHSALELHGLAHQIFYTVYVHSKKRFNAFSYHNVTYRHVDLKEPNFDSTEFKLHDQIVKCTNLERTILDCIFNLRLSGGWEEFYNSLNAEIKIDPILIFTDTHHIYRSRNTYRKVGFLFDHFQGQWKYNNKLYLQLKDVVKNNYLGQKELKRIRLFSETVSHYPLALNKEWNIKFPSMMEYDKEAVL